MPQKFSEFNLTLRLVDQIYVTDQDNTTQTLVSANLYVEQVTFNMKWKRYILLKTIIILMLIFYF